MYYVLELFFVLFLAHGLADFALQSDSMGRGKNRNRPVQGVPPGQTPATVWPYWLTAHASVHAGFVFLFTGWWVVALLELCAHWIIDFFKCENKLTVHQDQFLHIACKAVWVGLCVAYDKV